MQSKKIVFAISFLAVAGFIFNFGVSDAKAMTAAEIQALIQQLQAQIVALQKQLTETQAVEKPWCHDFNANLKIGDSGSEITALQTALTKDGSTKWLYKGYDGEFDEMTASEVVGFQQKYKDEILTPWGLKYGTGFVGKSTRAKLNKLYGCGIDVLPRGRQDVFIKNLTKYDYTKLISWNVDTKPEPGSTLGEAATFSWIYKINNISNYKINLNYQLVNSLTQEVIPSSYLGSGAIVLDPYYAIYYKLGGSVNLESGKSHRLELSISLSKYLNPEDVALRITLEEAILTSVPSITVISPNGGERWQYGSKQTVTWKSNGIPSGQPINIISLMGADGTEYHLVYDTPNDGSQEIILPTFEKSGDFKIKIETTVNKQSIIDLSDNYFSIVSATVAKPDLIVTDIYWSPVSPTSDYTGTVYAYVKVKNLGNAQANNFKIHLETKNTSIYNLWSPPVSLAAGQETSVWIGGYNVGTYEGFKPGDNLFTATADSPNAVEESDETNNSMIKTLNIPSATPSITVLFPNGGESFGSGNQMITWKQTGLNNKTFTLYLVGYDLVGNMISVKPIHQVISATTKEYLIQEVSAVTETVIGLTPAQYDYGISWNVPSDLVSRFESVPAKYKVGVWDRSTGIVDASDNYFSIAAAGTDLPDLVFEGLSASFPRYLNQPILVTFKMVNQGNAVASPATYIYSNQAGGYSSIDSSNTCTGSIILQPGQSCLSAYKFTFSTAGIKTIEVKLDPSNLLLESNENNNVISANLEVVAPSITVLSPNGGETLLEGSNYKISWNASNLPNDAKIYITLFRTGEANMQIVSNLPATQREYVWKVTTLGSWGMGYEYKPSLFAKIFGIGEVEAAGYSYKIMVSASWGSYGTNYYGNAYDNSNEWFYIDLSTPLTCSQLQEAPASASYFGTCKNNGYDKVCFNKYNYIYQGCGKSTYNDCTLNNTNASQNIWCDSATITVLWPNGGEQPGKGGTFQIRWKQVGLDNQTFTIYLVGYDSSGNMIPAKSGYQVFGSVNQEYLIQEVQATAISVDWTVPTDISSRFTSLPAKYKIGVWSRSTGIVDTSDNYFNLIESMGLNNMENQLADISKAVSNLIEQIKNLLGR